MSAVEAASRAPVLGSSAAAPLCIRHGSMADIPYCEDTWAKAAVKDRGGPLGERWVRVDGARLLLAPNEWHEMHRARIKATLGRSGILVGHRHDAPEVVWAWVAFELRDDATVLHWAWVRPELRRRGYGASLLRAVFVTAAGPVPIDNRVRSIPRVRCSHITAAGDALLHKVVARLAPKETP